MLKEKATYEILSGLVGAKMYIKDKDPEAQSIPQTHTGFEELFIVEGEIIDSDGAVFKKGDFVSFEPGNKHSSLSEKGALIVVFQRGINQPIKGM